ncbi:MAG: aminopeptidase N [Pseudomonadota bacterium]
MSNTRSKMLYVMTAGLVTILSACGNDYPESEQTAVSRPEASAVYRPELGTLTAQYAQFRKSQVSNPVYHLKLDLQANSDEFTGTVDIGFDLADENVSPITLDFDSGQIQSLSVNGTALDPGFEHWFLTIPITALVSGNNSITITYTRPFANDGAGLHKFIDPENGEEYFYTNFEPYNANRLFPNFDQPNLKAPLTLEVTAPSSWQVIANTTESEVIDEGDSKHWIFPPTAPLSSYVYAMHAGPYTVWESNAGNIPLRLFVRNALAAFVKPEEWFVPTQQSFAFFQNYFEVPYPFGKYDQIIVPDFNPGAMENVGAVTFNERYISRGDKSTAQLRNLASVIAHEMSHMWFGDLVTMDWWNGLWLNESFATYMANLELEQASSFVNAWDNFYIGNKLSAYTADQLITTHPIELEVPSTADAFTNFDGITYGKGGSVLRQLPFLIGEENFRKGVSNYLKKYSYGNTTLDNFVDELASASGMDLQPWKQEWLYNSGVNTIQPDFTCDDNLITSFRLLQTVPKLATADKILRSQRTQIGFYHYTDNQMIQSAAIPVMYSGSVTYVSEAIGLPCPDLALPNEGDWAFMKIKFDADSIQTLNEHINDFSNPTTRLMLWQSLWDSVDAGDLDLATYVAFVLDNLTNETDDNVVRHVNGTLSASFSYFSRFGDHEQEKANIEDFLFNQLEQAEPGSELQKIWYDNFVSHAHTSRALAYLAALLAETSIIEGLLLDQDKRWNIVVMLNRYYYSNYDELLAAEIVRDPSDQGQNMALAVEAVRPDAAIKDKWLDILIDAPQTYKLANMRTVMAYLFPDEQLALLEPKAERILAAIPLLNSTATEEYLGEFTGYMDAATCTPGSVSRLEKANREFANFKPLVTKSYLVHQQQDERCVRLKDVSR